MDPALFYGGSSRARAASPVIDRVDVWRSRVRCLQVPSRLCHCANTAGRGNAGRGLDFTWMNTDGHGQPQTRRTLGSVFGDPCPSAFIPVDRLTAAAMVAGNFASALTSPSPRHLERSEAIQTVAAPAVVLDCRTGRRSLAMTNGGWPRLLPAVSVGRRSVGVRASAIDRDGAIHRHRPAEELVSPTSFFHCLTRPQPTNRK